MAVFKVHEIAQMKVAFFLTTEKENYCLHPTIAGKGKIQGVTCVIPVLVLLLLECPLPPMLADNLEQKHPRKPVAVVG